MLADVGLLALSGAWGAFCLIVGVVAYGAGLVSGREDAEEDGELLGSAYGLVGNDPPTLYELAPPHDAAPWVDRLRRLIAGEAHPEDALRIDVRRVGTKDELT